MLADSVKVCPDHGKRRLDSNYCDICGKKLVTIEDSKLKIYEVEGLDPCPQCGYDLGHNHQKFCPGCGVALHWTCR